MRIVSLLPSATEILFALGRGNDVVAVSHECDYPPAARSLPRATASRIDSRLSSGQIDERVKSLSAAGEPLYEIDGALIARLAPDLIVTQSQCEVCAVRYADVVTLVGMHAELAATKVVALNPHSIDDLLADIQRLGEAAGAESASRLLVRQLTARIGAVHAAAAHLLPAERPRTLCLEWLDPPMAAGHWTPQLIAWAGGESILAVPGVPSPYVDWQEVQAADPDVILIACCGFDLSRSRREAATLESLTCWRDLRAVRTGRVFVLDGNSYLNRCGPRLVDTLELFASWLQPSLFGSPVAATLAEGVAWSRLATTPRD
ncbi:MAG: cobalamin-binding protein [Pirellulaceae bacterium]|nr:cobalamin-binding protein [Pirellulaceae bacterium]